MKISDEINDNYRVYLINLYDSTERLQAARQQLNNLQIKFQRVEAFDGRTIETSSIASYDRHKALNYMGRELNGGEIGCFFSHLHCVELFLDSGADYALVFEDDAVFSKDIKDIITKTITILENKKINWYLLNIGAHKWKIYTAIANVEQYEIRRAHYFPMLTTGLLWNRQGALQFVQKIINIDIPIDNFLHRWLSDNNLGLSIYPPLVRASGADSIIDAHQSRHEKDIKRHFFYGLIKQRRLWSNKIKALRHKYLSK